MPMLKDLLSQKFNLQKIKKIYLIPSKDISPDKIAKIHSSFKYDDESIIIRFNKTDLTNSKLFNNITDIRFIRGHTIGVHLKMGFKLLGDTSLDAIYIASNERLPELTQIKKSNNLKHLYSFGQMNVVYDYKTILSTLKIRSAYKTVGASIGFIAIYNLLNIFPEATFYLFDFTMLFRLNWRARVDDFITECLEFAS